MVGRIRACERCGKAQVLTRPDGGPRGYPGSGSPCGVGVALVGSSGWPGVGGVGPLVRPRDPGYRGAEIDWHLALALAKYLTTVGEERTS